MGRFACRVHPDKTMTPDAVYKCCNYPLFDTQFILELNVTQSRGADLFGCLPCDHSEQARLEDMNVVAILPLMYVERQFVEPVPSQAIAAVVTEDWMRQQMRAAVGRRPMFEIARVPPNLFVPPHVSRVAHIDLIDVAFHILYNFVASDYWNMASLPVFGNPRARIEEHMRQAMVSDAWDTERDTEDATLVRVVAPSIQDILTDTSQDMRLGRPTHGMFNRLETRVAFVRRARSLNDTAMLLKCFVPFMLVRRIDAAQAGEMLANNAAYQENIRAARAHEWHPVGIKDLH